MTGNYVPCYTSDFSRKELLELAELLSIDIKVAVATWLALNQWAQENAPTGCLAGISPSTIAAAAGPDPKQHGPRLLQALTDAGLLDEHAQLKDWNRYGGLLLAARIRKAESMRKHRGGEPGRGHHAAPTERQQKDHEETPRLQPSAKVEVKLKGPSDPKESPSEIQSGAGGAESHAPTHDYDWVNALVPGSISAAADETRFQQIFESRPDVDHTHELRKMFIKLRTPRSGRSWADAYASWVMDGKSHKLLPAHQHPEPPEPREISDDEYERIKEFGPADDEQFYAAIRYQHVHRLDS
jgi:hypothetical protein